MSTKSPAFQFYVRDWLNSRNVQKMKGDEVKAYMYLLCESWLEEPRASLPNDDSDLALMAKLPFETWLRVKPRVMANFNLIDGRWVNERLLGVSSQQQQFKKWGKMGGNPVLTHIEPKQVNPPLNPPLNPKGNLSSSSSSSTASASLCIEEPSLPDRNSKGKNKAPILSEEEWLSKLQDKFKGIDLDLQRKRAEAWLLSHPQRSFTRKFFINWLLRIDPPMSAIPKKKSTFDPFDPTPYLTAGTENVTNP